VTVLTSRLVTTVEAPVDKVFEAWLDPAAMAGWFWPFPATYEINAHVGGAFHFASEHIGVSGRYLEIEALALLAFTWVWDGENGETQVAVNFRSVSDGTELILEHTGNPDAETRDNHTQGWTDCVARLGPFLAS
jgi:uncharacterized protein YndB with AHSA1/START domain